MILKYISKEFVEYMIVEDTDTKEAWLCKIVEKLTPVKEKESA